MEAESTALVWVKLFCLRNRMVLMNRWKFWKQKNIIKAKCRINQQMLRSFFKKARLISWLLAPRGTPWASKYLNQIVHKGKMMKEWKPWGTNWSFFLFDKIFKTSEVYITQDIPGSSRGYRADPSLWQDAPQPVLQVVTQWCSSGVYQALTQELPEALLRTVLCVWGAQKANQCHRLRMIEAKGRLINVGQNASETAL